MFAAMEKKEIEIMASFGTRFIFGCILIILKQYAVHIDQDKKHIGFFCKNYCFGGIFQYLVKLFILLINFYIHAYLSTVFKNFFHFP